jgi:hypothetical protein
MKALRTLQAPVHFESGLVADLKLDAVDALSVGQSIRTLIRARKLPPGTAEIYERVARQMIAAARIALAIGGAK